MEKIWIIVFAIAFLCSGTSYADNHSSSWTFEGGIYAFVPVSVDDDSTVDGGTVDLGMGLDDVLAMLKFAASGRFEGWNDNHNNSVGAFGFVVDAWYVDLELDATAGGGDVEADITQGSVDLLAGYRFAPLMMNVSSNQALTFDIIGGVRYNYLKQKVKVSLALAAPFTADLGTSKNWFEPVIGARANYKLNDRWNLIVRGDVAGFDINDSTEWSATGIVAWRAWENTSLRLGYKCI